MPKDLTLILVNRPGTLAEAAEAMGRAGVNLMGACGFPSGGEGVFHVLVEDAAAARRAAESAGIEVRDEREALILDVAHRAGGLAEVLRPIADAGVNVDLVYLTEDGRLVLGADEIERARGAAGR